MSYEKTIERFALYNAATYDGTAEVGRVLGKVLGAHPELRSKAGDLKLDVERIVTQVNKMSLAEQKARLEELYPEMLAERPKETKTALRDFPNVTRGFVTRFEPSPSGPMHIGHAYVLGLISLYATKYADKNPQVILRIADTNASNIDPDAYDFLAEDAKWLCGNQITDIVVQSSRMNLYYSYALQLLERGGAYICTCPADEFRQVITKKMPCPCRENDITHNIKLWHQMFDGKKFNQGDAVMRIKTDVRHKNPAMRDFPLFRINDDEHPRTGKKYRVWPLMNFSVFCDDHDAGMTHIIRAKDHADNAKRQEYLYKYFDAPIPETLFVGRINFEGLNISASQTRKLISEGVYEGWDDIRIPFLLAFRRRGFVPETFLRYAMEVGVSLADKRVSAEEFYKAIHAFNKQALDEHADRYFFVSDPETITIKGAPELDVELHLHPEHRRRGRYFHTHHLFYVERADADKLKTGKLYRLMECLNFRKESNDLIFDSTDLDAYKKGGTAIMHWLPVSDDLVKVCVRMPNNQFISGLAEKKVDDLSVGDVVQFERFGFVRLDNDSGDEREFWFAHR